MEGTSISCLPTELFELVCSYLSFCDIGRLELSTKLLRNKIRDSRVWRKQAERFNKKFKYKMIGQMLDYTQRYNVNPKYFKIIIGIMGNLRKAMILLEKREKTFSDQAKTELDKVRGQGESVPRSINKWLTNVVKVFVQEELVKAKKKQILTFNDDLTINKEGSQAELVEPALSETRLASLFNSEDPDVTLQIQKFASWIEERIAPTEEEVMLCARTKAGEIMEQVHQVFIENQLPG